MESILPDLKNTRLLEWQYRNICWRLQMMLQLELSVDMNRIIIYKCHKFDVNVRPGYKC